MWLDNQAEERQEDPKPTVMTEVGEPLTKKLRDEEKEEVGQTVSENKKSSESWVMAMESLMEKTRGRYANNTLQTLAETLVKINRNIKRIGEGMQKEY